MIDFLSKIKWKDIEIIFEDFLKIVFLCRDDMKDEVRDSAEKLVKDY